MTQSQEILRYLEDGGSLTPIDALVLFSCFRLGARIHELKAEGHPIRSRIVKSRDGKRWAEYSMGQAGS